MEDPRPLLRELLGGPVVAYHPRLAHFVGGVKAAVLLSQLYYISSQQADPDAAFDVGVDALEASTGLSVKEQASARDELAARQLIAVTRKGMPRRYFYRVDLPALVSMIAGQLPLPGVAVSPKGRHRSRPGGDTGVAQGATQESPVGRITTRGRKRVDDAAATARPPADRPVPETPPAILVCRRVARAFPHKSLWDSIVATVGCDEADLRKWAQTIEEWIGRGHNPRAWAKMLDVFRAGWRDQASADQPGGSRRPGPDYDPAADVAAYRRQRGMR